MTCRPQYGSTWVWEKPLSTTRQHGLWPGVMSVPWPPMRPKSTTALYAASSAAGGTVGVRWGGPDRRGEKRLRGRRIEGLWRRGDGKGLPVAHAKL